MKKLVLFFAVAAAVSFAACSNANKAQEATEEVAAEVVEAVEETATVVDSVATEVVEAVEEVAAPAN